MIKKPFKISLYLIAILLILFQSAYATNIVRLSPGYFPNSSIGRALSSADIYVGKPDLDPEIVANQKQLSVQQENGTIVNVSQPISTGAGGVPLYNGSPVTLLVEGDYSLKVNDSSGSQIYYIPSVASQELIPGNYYYPDYNETDQGVAGDGNSVEDILTAVGGSTNATMYFAHNSGSITTTYTFTTNEIVTDNFNIIIENGAIINGAGTLTINGPFEAGSYQVFGSGITVIFGDGVVETILPQYFGALGDGSNDDTSSIQAAVVAAEASASCPPVHFLVTGNYYKVTSPITLTGNKQLVLTGDSYIKSIIKAVNVSPYSAVFLFDNSTHHNLITFRDLIVDCNSAANYGFYSEYNAGAGGNSHTLIEHVRVQGALIEGVHFEYGWDIDIINSTFINNVGGIQITNSGNALNIINTKVFNNTGVGIYWNQGSGGRISGCTIESNEKGGLVINAVEAPSVTGNYFENNGTDTVDENFAVWWGSISAYAYGGEFSNNFISGNAGDPTGLSGVQLGYANGVRIEGNRFERLNYAFDASRLLAVTAFMNNTIENNSIDSGTVTTNWNPHATYEVRYAWNQNRISIPGTFGRSSGNLITEHPVEWARTVTGASVCNVVAGEYPAFTMTEAVGEDAAVTLTLDFENNLRYLRGKYVTLGVTVVSASTGNFSLYIGGDSYTLSIGTTIVDHSITYKIGAAETTLAFQIRANTNAIDFTIYDFWITEGTVKPSQRIWNVPVLDAFTWDPGSLNDGEGETVSETVYGAEFGDFVQISAPYDLQDCVVTGYVQAADTVEARLQNESTGVRDLASGTWEIRITK